MSIAPRRVHPWIFMVLILPFGMVGGYASVTLAYLLKAAGVSVAQVTALVALGLLPQTWKFFWGPVIDITLDQRKWYVLSCVVSSVTLGMMGFFPPTRAGLAALSILVFVSSLATTFLGMACESLIAHSTPDQLRGHVAGWYQAGNLGGAGIGGGLALYLARHLPAPWMASAIVGALCLLCCFALLGAPLPQRAFETTSVWHKLSATARDVWQVARQRTGILAMVLCLLPIGTSAAPFAAVATEWHASGETVALVSGVLGGIVAAVGCLLGGWACDRMNRKMAYVWFGFLQAACGIAMALLPRTSTMFVAGVLLYTGTSGLTYAAFSAFTLEAIGKGAAATKYNALASISNLPIYYMTTIDGWAHDRWNSRGMFYLEAGLAIASGLIFMVLVRIIWPARSQEGSPELAPANQPGTLHMS